MNRNPQISGGPDRIIADRSDECQFFPGSVTCTLKEYFTSFLQVKEKIQQEKAAKAEESMKTALDENDLEHVAGGTGKNAGCDSTYTEDEWCWFSDSCSLLISDYDDECGAASNAGIDVFDEEEFSADQILRGEHYGAGREEDPGFF